MVDINYQQYQPLSVAVVWCEFADAEAAEAWHGFEAYAASAASRAGSGVPWQVRFQPGYLHVSGWQMITLW